MGDGTQPQDLQRIFASEGVQLLRTAMQVQYQLSQMADQKASMLLGITFVVFTVAVGQWKMGDPQPALLIMAASAFISALLAVAAVLPSVKPSKQPDATHNILFFGAFTRMPEEEYVQRLMAVVEDPHRVHEAFARDIYQNGRVLAFKKYRLIGHAYRVILAGLLLSFLVFVAHLGWQALSA